MIEANEAVKAPWLKAYGDLPFHLESVSYTHLDVYKRQPLTTKPIKIKMIKTIMASIKSPQLLQESISSSQQKIIYADPDYL